LDIPANYVNWQCENHSRASLQQEINNLDAQDIVIHSDLDEIVNPEKIQHIIDYMNAKGALLEDSMKKDTFVLIVKSKEDLSNKTKYAKENNIPIMTTDEFKDNYM
jgi:hypothetical protein